MGKDRIKKHKNEKYYKQAQRDGMRSRAAYKLRQIQKRFKIFNDVRHVLDLGCAPGGWVQEIQREFNTISIIGVDLEKVSPIEGVIFIQGDITEETVFEKLDQKILKEVDVILSDCAPKLSGSKETDYARHVFLVEHVLKIVNCYLKEKGHFVCKLFDGEYTTKLRNQLKQKFEIIHLFKPEASKKKSPELYLIGKYYKKQE